MSSPPWTKQEEELLEHLFKQNLTDFEIAQRFAEAARDGSQRGTINLRSEKSIVARRTKKSLNRGNQIVMKRALPRSNTAALGVEELAPNQCREIKPSGQCGKFFRRKPGRPALCDECIKGKTNPANADS